ncbi:uncharacterized protein LOC119674931, partial [Teleopsis dalmanni]|uniref:uncharacterized protein LOC119674931 n=1 Tax=Teleopsis dalmanni TaxID=139649 RepID=UPI0018CEFB83
METNDIGASTAEANAIQGTTTSAVSGPDASDPRGFPLNATEVHRLPKISFSDNSSSIVRCVPNERATFFVKIDCEDEENLLPLKFEWSRGEIPIENSDRFRITQTSNAVQLAVEHVQRDDAGHYTLFARTKGNDVIRKDVELIVEDRSAGDDPPIFLRRLIDLSVKVGTRTRLLAEIRSSTDVKLTWYRNDRRICENDRVKETNEGTFHYLEISPVILEDGGQWMLMAENLSGRNSCIAHLNVLVPKAYKAPEFIDELKAVLTEQGTVSLECKVVGVPTPQLRWFKDSKEIKAGDVYALTANAEDPTSLGTYTCEAVNCMGKSYSRSKLHVVGRGSREGSLKPADTVSSNASPPIFTNELRDASIRIGDTLILGCQVVVPPWPKSVTWYNKVGRVESCEKYKLIEDGLGVYMIEVKPSDSCDEGEWKCVVTSLESCVGISTCNVKMDIPKNYRKPRFMESLRAVLTEEGLVSFECKVVGFPTPILKWFKDGQELKPGDVYQLTGTNSLGTYCCTAKNCMGESSSVAVLTVEDIENQLNDEERLMLASQNQPPKFVVGLKSQDAKINEPFQFTVNVKALPDPILSWFRDELPIEPNERYNHYRGEKENWHLDIRTVEFVDQAEWKCVAVNDFGTSITSCFLKLQIPRHYKKPRFLECLRAVLTEEGAVNLECKVIGVPQPVLKWYKDGVELKPGDIHRIISGQDGTCCLGTYTCEARNCMGVVASSASLLGFEDAYKNENAAKTQEKTENELQRNFSLSTIQEERTSQLYETPMGDITIDEKGDISFSFDGKEVSVSLYETPDITEEEALKIVEMYADQISEHITEHNIVELPPLRCVKETSQSGKLLMEAVVIDICPEYFSHEEDMRTEADMDDISITEITVHGSSGREGVFDKETENFVQKSFEKMEEELSLSAPVARKRKKSRPTETDEFFSLSKASSSQGDDDTSDLQTYASAQMSAKVESTSAKKSDATEQTDSVKPPKRKKGKKQSDTDSSKTGDEEAKLLDISGAVGDGLMMPASQPTKVISNAAEIDRNLKCLLPLAKSLQIVENNLTAVKSEVVAQSAMLMTASSADQSIAIIHNVIEPISQIHSKLRAYSGETPLDVLFQAMEEDIRKLHTALQVIEKCVEIDETGVTLIQRTSVCIIDSIGNHMIKALGELKNVARHFEKASLRAQIELRALDIQQGLEITQGTIKTQTLIQEAQELEAEKHLSETVAKLQEAPEPLPFDKISKAELPSYADALKIVCEPVVKIQEALERVENELSLEQNEEEIYKKVHAKVLENIVEPIKELQVVTERIEQKPELLTGIESMEQKVNMAILDIVTPPLFELKKGLEIILNEPSGNIESGMLTVHTVEAMVPPLQEIQSGLSQLGQDIQTGQINEDFGLDSADTQKLLQSIAQSVLHFESNIERLSPRLSQNIQTGLYNLKEEMSALISNILDGSINKYHVTLFENLKRPVDEVNYCLRQIEEKSMSGSLADLIDPLHSLNERVRLGRDILSIPGSQQNEKHLRVLDQMHKIIKNIEIDVEEHEFKILQKEIKLDEIEASEQEKSFISMREVMEIKIAQDEIIGNVSNLYEIISEVCKQQTLDGSTKAILTNLQKPVKCILTELKTAQETIDTTDSQAKKLNKYFVQVFSSLPIQNLVNTLQGAAKVVGTKQFIQHVNQNTNLKALCVELQVALSQTATGIEVPVEWYNTPTADALNEVVNNLEKLVQHGTEVAEESSTLEDISIIKSVTESLPPEDKSVSKSAIKSEQMTSQVVTEESKPKEKVENMMAQLKNSISSVLMQCAEINPSSLQIEVAKQVKATVTTLQDIAQSIAEKQQISLMEPLISMSECSSDHRTLADAVHSLEQCIVDVQQFVLQSELDELSDMQVSELKVLAAPLTELQQSLQVFHTQELEQVISMSTPQVTETAADVVQGLRACVLSINELHALEALESMAVDESLSHLKQFIAPIQELTKAVLTVEDQMHLSQIETLSNQESLAKIAEFAQSLLGIQKALVNVQEITPYGNLEECASLKVVKDQIAPIYELLKHCERVNIDLLENAKELSTQEDISALKTFADIKPSAFKLEEPVEAKLTEVKVSDLRNSVAGGLKHIQNCLDLTKETNVAEIHEIGQVMQELKSGLEEIQNQLVKSTDQPQETVLANSNIAKTLFKLKECLVHTYDSSEFDSDSALDDIEKTFEEILQTLPTLETQLANEMFEKIRNEVAAFLNIFNQTSSKSVLNELIGPLTGLIESLETVCAASQKNVEIEKSSMLIANLQSQIMATFRAINETNEVINKSLLIEMEKIQNGILTIFDTIEQSDSNLRIIELLQEMDSLTPHLKNFISKVSTINMNNLIKNVNSAQAFLLHIHKGLNDNDKLTNTFMVENRQLVEQLENTLVSVENELIPKKDFLNLTTEQYELIESIEKQLKVLQEKLVALRVLVESTIQLEESEALEYKLDQKMESISKNIDSKISKEVHKQDDIADSSLQENKIDITEETFKKDDEKLEELRIELVKSPELEKAKKTELQQDEEEIVETIKIPEQHQPEIIAQIDQSQQIGRFEEIQQLEASIDAVTTVEDKFITEQVITPTILQKPEEMITLQQVVNIDGTLLEKGVESTEELIQNAGVEVKAEEMITETLESKILATAEATVEAVKQKMQTTEILIKEQPDIAGEEDKPTEQLKQISVAAEVTSDVSQEVLISGDNAMPIEKQLEVSTEAKVQASDSTDDVVNDMQQLISTPTEIVNPEDNIIPVEAEIQNKLEKGEFSVTDLQEQKVEELQSDSIIPETLVDASAAVRQQQKVDVAEEVCDQVAQNKEELAVEQSILQNIQSILSDIKTAKDVKICKSSAEILNSIETIFNEIKLAILSDNPTLVEDNLFLPMFKLKDLLSFIKNTPIKMSDVDKPLFCGLVTKSDAIFREILNNKDSLRKAFVQDILDTIQPVTNTVITYIKEAYPDNAVLHPVTSLIQNLSEELINIANPNTVTLDLNTPSYINTKQHLTDLATILKELQVLSSFNSIDTKQTNLLNLIDALHKDNIETMEFFEEVGIVKDCLLALLEMIKSEKIHVSLNETHKEENQSENLERINVLMEIIKNNDDLLMLENELKDLLNQPFDDERFSKIVFKLKEHIVHTYDGGPLTDNEQTEMIEKLVDSIVEQNAHVSHKLSNEYFIATIKNLDDIQSRINSLSNCTVYEKLDRFTPILKFLKQNAEELKELKEVDKSSRLAASLQKSYMDIFILFDDLGTDSQGVNREYFEKAKSVAFQEYEDIEKCEKPFIAVKASENLFHFTKMIDEICCILQNSELAILPENFKDQNIISIHDENKENVKSNTEEINEKNAVTIDETIKDELLNKDTDKQGAASKAEVDKSNDVSEVYQVNEDQNEKTDISLPETKEVSLKTEEKQKTETDLKELIEQQIVEPSAAEPFSIDLIENLKEEASIEFNILEVVATIQDLIQNDETLQVLADDINALTQVPNTSEELAKIVFKLREHIVHTYDGGPLTDNNNDSNAPQKLMESLLQNEEVHKQLANKYYVEIIKNTDIITSKIQSLEDNPILDKLHLLLPTVDSLKQITEHTKDIKELDKSSEKIVVLQKNLMNMFVLFDDITCLGAENLKSDLDQVKKTILEKYDSIDNLPQQVDTIKICENIYQVTKIVDNICDKLQANQIQSSEKMEIDEIVEKINEDEKSKETEQMSETMKEEDIVSDDIQDLTIIKSVESQTKEEERVNVTKEIIDEVEQKSEQITKKSMEEPNESAVQLDSVNEIKKAIIPDNEIDKSSTENKIKAINDELLQKEEVDKQEVDASEVVEISKSVESIEVPQVNEDQNKNTDISLPETEEVSLKTEEKQKPETDLKELIEQQIVEPSAAEPFSIDLIENLKEEASIEFNILEVVTTIQDLIQNDETLQVLADDINALTQVPNTSEELAKIVFKLREHIVHTYDGGPLTDNNNDSNAPQKLMESLLQNEEVHKQLANKYYAEIIKNTDIITSKIQSLEDNPISDKLHLLLPTVDSLKQITEHIKDIKELDKSSEKIVVLQKNLMNMFVLFDDITCLGAENLKSDLDQVKKTILEKYDSIDNLPQQVDTIKICENIYQVTKIVDNICDKLQTNQIQSSEKMEIDEIVEKINEDEKLKETEQMSETMKEEDIVSDDIQDLTLIKSVEPQTKEEETVNVTKEIIDEVEQKSEQITKKSMEEPNESAVQLDSVNEIKKAIIPDNKIDKSSTENKIKAINDELLQKEEVDKQEVDASEVVEISKSVESIEVPQVNEDQNKKTDISLPETEEVSLKTEEKQKPETDLKELIEQQIVETSAAEPFSIDLIENLKEEASIEFNILEVVTTIQDLIQNDETLQVLADDINALTQVPNTSEELAKIVFKLREHIVHTYDGGPLTDNNNDSNAPQKLMESLLQNEEVHKQLANKYYVEIIKNTDIITSKIQSLEDNPISDKLHLLLPTVDSLKQITEHIKDIKELDKSSEKIVVLQKNLMNMFVLFDDITCLGAENLKSDLDQVKKTILEKYDSIDNLPQQVDTIKICENIYQVTKIVDNICDKLQANQIQSSEKMEIDEIVEKINEDEKSKETEQMSETMKEEDIVSDDIQDLTIIKSVESQTKEEERVTVTKKIIDEVEQKSEQITKKSMEEPNESAVQLDSVNEIKKAIIPDNEIDKSSTENKIKAINDELLQKEEVDKQEVDASEVVEISKSVESIEVPQVNEDQNKNTDITLPETKEVSLKTEEKQKTETDLKELIEQQIVEPSAAEPFSIDLIENLKEEASIEFNILEVVATIQDLIQNDETLQVLADDINALTQVPNTSEELAKIVFKLREHIVHTYDGGPLTDNNNDSNAPQKLMESLLQNEEVHKQLANKYYVEIIKNTDIITSKIQSLEDNSISEKLHLLLPTVDSLKQITEHIKDIKELDKSSEKIVVLQKNLMNMFVLFDDITCLGAENLKSDLDQVKKTILEKYDSIDNLPQQVDTIKICENIYQVTKIVDNICDKLQANQIQSSEKMEIDELVEKINANEKLKETEQMSETMKEEDIVSDDIQDLTIIKSVESQTKEEERVNVTKEIIDEVEQKSEQITKKSMEEPNESKAQLHSAEEVKKPISSDDEIDTSSTELSIDASKLEEAKDIQKLKSIDDNKLEEKIVKDVTTELLENEPTQAANAVKEADKIDVKRVESADDTLNYVDNLIAVEVVAQQIEGKHPTIRKDMKEEIEQQTEKIVEDQNLQYKKDIEDENEDVKNQSMIANVIGEEYSEKISVQEVHLEKELEMNEEVINVIDDKFDIIEEQSNETTLHSDKEGTVEDLKEKQSRTTEIVELHPNESQEQP